MSNLLTIDTQDFDEDDLLAGNIIYTETGKTQVISITVKDSERGKPGEGVPTGGTTGQYLVKVSDTDYDTAWQTINIPAKTSDLINNSGFITASDIPITSVNGQTGNVTINVPTKTSELVNDSDFQTSADTASYIAIHNASLSAHPDLRNKISDIDDLIPNQASISNQLADKNFVNSSVQTATANFRGNWTDWADVPTVATDYPADYAGNKTPTVNDYLVVQDASDYTLETLEGTWRFKYTGDWDVDGKAGWQPEYQVNETPLTAAQLAALNSGITAGLVANIPTVQNIVITIGVDGGGNMVWSGADSIADVRTAFNGGGSVRVEAPALTEEIYNVTEVWWKDSNQDVLVVQSVDNDAALIQIGLADDYSVEMNSVNLQQKLQEGTNISIVGNTISATVPTITVDSALDNTSANPVQNQALYPAIVGSEIRVPVYTSAWSEPAGSNPYNSVAIITLPTGTFTDNSLIELTINDQFNFFAKYGFVLYGHEVETQRLWLTSIGKPTSTVYLTFRIYNYGS